MTLFAFPKTYKSYKKSTRLFAILSTVNRKLRFSLATVMSVLLYKMFALPGGSGFQVPGSACGLFTRIIAQELRGLFHYEGNRLSFC
jgi:hypothetical protein